MAFKFVHNCDNHFHIHGDYNFCKLSLTVVAMSIGCYVNCMDVYSLVICVHAS